MSNPRVETAPLFEQALEQPSPESRLILACHRARPFRGVSLIDDFPVRWLVTLFGHAESSAELRGMR
jgi:hypothetical protein